MYIIKSQKCPDQIYVGFTMNVTSRLAKHNEGGSTHTSKYKPWELCWFCAFPSKHQAIEFEQYLKSHSGKAFASKRLI
ncbi:MAG: GIY-YIG nuclease family protein [Kiritimatiellae bacterium]|jgi:putative endonuclease|nr:GIY-YIG nuclease family protein [Kiritimatiellia bacterium]